MEMLKIKTDEQKPHHKRGYERRAANATKWHRANTDALKTDSDEEVDEHGNPIQRRQHMGGGGGRPQRTVEPVNYDMIDAHMSLDIAERNHPGIKKDTVPKVGYDIARSATPDAILGALGHVVEVTFVPSESPITVRAN